MIKTFSLFLIHSYVRISHLSPAIETDRRVEMLNLSTHEPSWSSFLIDLRPVGLVYRPFTLYIYIIDQSAPGLGVVGLPSYNTVAAPLSIGP